jgi:hypothetical protein
VETLYAEAVEHLDSSPSESRQHRIADLAHPRECEKRHSGSVETLKSQI